MKHYVWEQVTDGYFQAWRMETPEGYVYRDGASGHMCFAPKVDSVLRKSLEDISANIAEINAKTVTPPDGWSTK